MVLLFIALPRSVLAVTVVGIGCKQVRQLSLASTPRPSLRDFHVGPAGLRILPRGYRLLDSGSDLLLEAVDSALEVSKSREVN